jgi:hypothetical protein
VARPCPPLNAAARTGRSWPGHIGASPPQPVPWRVQW